VLILAGLAVDVLVVCLGWRLVGTWAQRRAAARSGGAAPAVEPAAASLEPAAVETIAPPTLGDRLIALRRASDTWAMTLARADRALSQP